MSLLNFLNKNNQDINWDSLKNSNEVYPENSISIAMGQTESGKPATGWIDLGYQEYKFKKQCPYNLELSVEIDTQKEQNESIDMGTVEDYFINALKKGCVTHPISRMATDFGLIMDIYIDDVEFASNLLQEMFEGENKKYEFGCGFNKDPKWKTYNKIIKLLS